jgi:hypothetical protein
MGTISHVLPLETGGDTSWFERQNPYEQQETRRQAEFKRRHFPGLPDGHSTIHPEHHYPHILPEGHLDKAFYPRLSQTILDYLNEQHIATHSEVLNLRSSQTACLNFLFPLRQDPDLATAVFGAIWPDLERVTTIEFEFTGEPGATLWMGEPRSGRRGQNRTSIDAAMFWKNRQGLSFITLIEWKYTERNFGACSAFYKAAQKEQANCLGLNVANDPHPERACLLTTGKRHRQRRYWEHMSAAGISLLAFQAVVGCPYQGPFYQLMRQHLLAAYLRHASLADCCEVCVVHFALNESLNILPVQLQPLTPGRDLITAWNAILNGTPPMRVLHAETLAAAIERAPCTAPEWRVYLKERYGV